MPYLAPYRHELRDVVKPLADAITATRTHSTGRRFDSVLDEIEELLQAGTIPSENAEKEYVSVVTACRENPREVSDGELARAVAAVTVATKTDILGALYQLIGRTAEDYFNQYFTPPNAADALRGIGESTRGHFEPPEPTVENVSGQSALGMFGGETSDSARTDGGAIDDPNDGTTIFFDPACGSGRLLLAAGRGTENAVCLGWDIERTAARMTALTLGLVGIPGWVVGGDALTMGMREIYRIGADSENTPQYFRSYQPEDAPEMPKSRDYDSGRTRQTLRSILVKNSRLPPTASRTVSPKSNASSGVASTKPLGIPHSTSATSARTALARSHSADSIPLTERSVTTTRKPKAPSGTSGSSSSTP